MVVAGFIAKAPKKMHRWALHPGWVGVAKLSLRQVPKPTGSVTSGQALGSHLPGASFFLFTSMRFT